MIRLLLILLVLSWSMYGSAQTSFGSHQQVGGFQKQVKPSSEIGGFLGGSYYTGELNHGGHFNTNFTHLSYGALFRRNFNGRWAFRVHAFFGNVSGSDYTEKFIIQKIRKAKLKLEI